MTAEQEAYLSWLRYALWGGGRPALVEGSLPDILELANRQKTRGLVFEAMLRDSGSQPGMTKDGAGLTEERKARMKQLLLRILATHRMLDAAVAQALGALRQAGIPAVLLKGQGAARNYPDPQLRECGDIDIYIGPERLEEAVRVLTPLAYKVDDKLVGKHWQLWIGQAEIELHQHTMLPDGRRRTRFFRQLEEEGLRHNLVPLDFGGVSADTPGDTFNTFYLFYHAWHHFITGGVGFRQLCDWTLLLHKHQDRIDRERLREMLDGMRLLFPWQLFGCIAVRDLGLPEQEFPFYDPARYGKSRRVLDVILAEGNFGRGRQPRRERPKGYVAGKAHSLGLHVSRFRKMLRIVPAEAWQTFRATVSGGFARVFKDLLHK